LTNKLESLTNEPAPATNLKSKTSFSFIDAFSRNKQSKTPGNSLSVKEKHPISKSSENNSTTQVPKTAPQIVALRNGGGKTNFTNSLSPNRVSLMGSSQQSSNEPSLYLVPGSISSSDLQCSTSSLLAFVANSTDEEIILKTPDDFQHVSYKIK
jgi:hypothetical protein